jgi:hypothetical protein
MRNACKILVGNTEQKRSFWRRALMGDNTKINKVRIWAGLEQDTIAGSFIHSNGTFDSIKD